MTYSISEKLFNEIIAHRQKFTSIKTVDYGTLSLKDLKIIPPNDIIELYRKDYKEMQESMIYGKSLNFAELIKLLNDKYTGGKKI